MVVLVDFFNVFKSDSRAEAAVLIKVPDSLPAARSGNGRTAPLTGKSSTPANGRVSDPKSNNPNKDAKMALNLMFFVIFLSF